MEPTLRNETPTANALAPMALGIAAVAAAVAILMRLGPVFAGTALAAFVPFIFNLTPLGALSLFGGARLRFWQACAFPLGVMVLTDVLLWIVLRNRPFDPFVYGSYLIYIALGRLVHYGEGRLGVGSEGMPGFLQFGVSALLIGGAGVAGCLQFFVVTNFGYFLSGLNGYTWQGLVKTYVDAIPFFKPTYTGDLVYIPVLFGAYALAVALRPVLTGAREPVAIDAD